ncbi:unnamed protein product [Clonostachys rosea]|uniref:Gfo/Idh/MocA-like oxidoreductase N-terminal domain-containing protein n=1 Tax=Bionectria ochroleuca TaxID=29856 RepID=A0ABY6U2K0_BIOOC|nr:unnamed protein product [Clonostachys rosea]
MEAGKYRVGVIGYGLSSKVFHIPFILNNSRFELGAIVQRSGDEAKTRHSPVTIHRSTEALFEDKTIDLVVVSTPPPTHFPLVMVVEKPFCTTSKECDELIDLAKAKGKLLTVFQNRRWDADFVTLKKLLEDNVLGRVVEFESHFDRYDPQVPPRDATPTPGSGVIYDLGTHLLDQILHIYGLPSRVTGFLDRQRSGADPNGVFDACTILLHYDTGLLATVKASPLSADKNQLRFWVRGEKGSYKKHHLDPQEPQIIGGMEITDAKFGLEEAGNEGILTISQNGTQEPKPHPNVPPPTYSEFYNILGTALDGNGPVPVRPEDARNVIRIVELAQESAAKGETLALNKGEAR